MSHLSRIFSEAPVKVQNKNGFDLSHLNCGTSKCGQLVPVLCKLLPPNSDFTLGVNMTVELPPLVAPVMGRIDAIVEGFVVPCSILYGGWKQFISNNPASAFPELGEDVTPLNVPGSQIPYFRFPQIQSQHSPFNTLYQSNENVGEYLGLRYGASSIDALVEISLLPFIAYHMIWDVFYRNKQVTKSIFIPAAGSYYGESSPITSVKQVGRIPNAIYFGLDAKYTGGNSGDISLQGSHFIKILILTSLTGQASLALASVIMHAIILPPLLSLRSKVMPVVLFSKLMLITKMVPLLLALSVPQIHYKNFWKLIILVRTIAI